MLVYRLYELVEWMEQQGDCSGVLRGFPHELNFSPGERLLSTDHRDKVALTHRRGKTSIGFCGMLAGGGGAYWNKRCPVKQKRFVNHIPEDNRKSLGRKYTTGGRRVSMRCNNSLTSTPYHSISPQRAWV